MAGGAGHLMKKSVEGLPDLGTRTSNDRLGRHTQLCAVNRYVNSHYKEMAGVSHQFAQMEAALDSLQHI